MMEVVHLQKHFQYTSVHLQDEIDFSMECPSDNSSAIRTKYPIHSCSLLLVISAALAVMVIGKNISVVAFDSLMSLLRVSFLFLGLILIFS